MLLDPVSLLLIALGTGLCPLVARWVGGGPRLAWVLLGAFAPRTALAVGLYLISAHQLPLLRELQLPGGFWQFARDAQNYHLNAVRLAQALSAHAPLPQVMYLDQSPHLLPSYDHFYLVGLVYWALGAHPLRVPLLNCLLWIGIGALAYLLARRLGSGGQSALLAAGVVSFWPSGFIWSSQILKDSLVLALLLAGLYLVLRSASGRRWSDYAAGALVGPVVFPLARLREELALALAGAVVVWLGLRLVMARQVELAVCLAGLGLVGTALVAPSADVAGLLYPPGVARVEAPAPAGPPSPVVAQGTLAGLVGRLAYRRSVYALAGGGSAFATEVQFTSLGEVLAYLPRGFAYALYAPFPWEWFPADGDTGVLKPLSGIEGLLILGLTPFFALGLARSIQQRRPEAWLLALFALSALAGMGLVVTNAGTVFRLRLSALLPLLILASAHGLPGERLEQVARRVARRRAGGRPRRAASGRPSPPRQAGHLEAS